MDLVSMDSLSLKVQICSVGNVIHEHTPPEPASRDAREGFRLGLFKGPGHLLHDTQEIYRFQNWHERMFVI